MQSISLVSLGSTDSSVLATTISKSLPFANTLVKEWIFVLFTESQVNSFQQYLEYYQLNLNRFRLIVLCCNSGIALSINLGVSISSSEWVLILHSGDNLVPLSPVCYEYIMRSLSDFKTNIHVFRTNYFKNNTFVGISKLPSKYVHFKFLPWIPHESVFVRSSIYDLFLYDASYSSALDFDFFLRLQLLPASFMTHKIAITEFHLGGKSSDVLLSSFEVARSIRRNITANYLLSYFFGIVAFVYLLFAKNLYLLRSSFSSLIK